MTWLKKRGLYWLNQLPMADIQNKLNTYFKFMITRHPYDRLVSAYINKIVYGRFVSLPGLRIRHLTTFLDILTMTSQDLTKLTQNMTSSDQRKWRSFHHINRHWHEQLTLCHPCFIEYDYIGKLETIDDDQRYILPHIGATESVLTTLNKSTNKTDHQTSAEYHDALASYNKLRMLQQRYQMDFDAFGYDPKTMQGSGCERDLESNECCSNTN
jgi:hypothetical protein